MIDLQKTVRLITWLSEPGMCSVMLLGAGYSIGLSKSLLALLLGTICFYMLVSGIVIRVYPTIEAVHT